MAAKSISPTPISVGSNKQLLIDHRFIEQSEGVSLTVNPPDKLPVPVMVADRPWESMCVAAWQTVIKEGSVYRMWYEAFDSGYRNDYDDRLCYATSDDGVHWEKPELGLVEFEGSKANNIVFNNEGRGLHGGSVFVDPHDAPDRRYKCIFVDGNGRRAEHWNQCVRGAHSPDGIHWKPYPDLLADHLSDTQSVARFDPEIGKYVGYFRTWSEGGTGFRCIGRSETGSFETWPCDAETVIKPDENDPPGMDLYTNAYLRYPFAQDVHLIFTSAFYHTPDTLDVQLAASRDGVHWARPDRRPFIRLGPDGAWDSKAIYAGVGLVREGDRLAMYYGGYNHTHGENVPSIARYAGGIGRATMRLDGYISADAGYGGGSLTTPPITFEGDSLELNVDCGAGGSMKVAILDAEGHPIPGFGWESSDTIWGNSVARKTTWQGKSDLGRLAGTPVRLAFQMRDAKLYAFQFVGREHRANSGGARDGWRYHGG